MKICPNCRRTYDDDGLNFCLDDGSVLTFTSPDAAPTVVMEYPRPTSTAPPAGSTTSWDARNQPAYATPPKKSSSKTWVWVVGIFAILILVCGGGFAAFFVYMASIANSNTNISRSTTNSSSTKANTASRTPAANTAWDGDAHAVNLSDWVKDPTSELETELVGDEFFMTTKQTDHYYVLVATDAEFSTARTSRVTVRNPDDSAAELGYGLVFHSDSKALVNDYALLIDTAKKMFRVVRHEREQEKTITEWTSANSIKDNGAANVLESRNKGDKIELYINDTLVSSIVNRPGPKKGVPGLYVGNGARIGFKKLEVVK